MFCRILLTCASNLSCPYTETVTIQIGVEKVPFVLYKAFLVHYSPYFKKALTGNFVEASTGIIHLEHTTVKDSVGSGS